MRSLSIAKFGKYPSSGVYYCLPNKSKTGWVLSHITERDVDTGEGSLPESELSHAQQYSFVVSYFQENFGVDISDIGRRCLPRGRIIDQKDGKGFWIILHGDDTPGIMRHQIISEFGLSGVRNSKWQYDEYESMKKEQTERLITRCPFMKDLL